MIVSHEIETVDDEDQDEERRTKRVGLRQMMTMWLSRRVHSN